MKYNLKGVLVVIDEISTTADIYISSSNYSVIEQHESTRRFLCFYNSASQNAQVLSDKLTISKCGQIIFIKELQPEMTSQCVFKPIIITNENQDSIIYFPGCILFNLFRLSVGKHAKFTVGCFEPRYLLKQQPILLSNQSVVQQIQEFTLNRTAVLNYPLGYDLEFVLQQVEHEQDGQEILFQYRNEPDALKRRFSLGIPLSFYTHDPDSYFAAVLKAHQEYCLKDQLLVTIIPLFNPGQQQIQKENNKMLAFLKCFQTITEIQKLVQYYQIQTVQPSCAFGNENDIEGKLRRLKRIAGEHSVQQQQLLEITEMQMKLLQQAQML